MATNITTVKGRDALKLRHSPYWHKIGTGCFLGLRKTTRGTAGSWIARYRNDDSGAQQLHSLGRFEDFAPTDRFDRATQAAKEWFDHMGRGGNAGAVTVRQACENYVKHLAASGRQKTSHDAESRFKRWVYADATFGGIELQRLSPKDMNKWRVNLAGTMAIPQDKTKAATQPRSDSTLNRDMTTLKAALNLAHENGDVTSDHAWKIKLRPVKDADGRRDVYLDAENRRKLIANAPDHLAALLKALSLVPLRPGAMAGLTAGDYDKRLATLTIGADKRTGDRKITLPKMTAAFFAQQAKDKLPGAPLLARANGAAWNKDSWKGPFKAAVIAAGLPTNATAYALRHSTITDLIALHRLDTLTVAQLAGTSLQMIEKHYGHLLRDHAAKALASLAL